MSTPEQQQAALQQHIAAVVDQRVQQALAAAQMSPPPFSASVSSSPPPQRDPLPAAPRIANPAPFEGKDGTLDGWLSKMRQQFNWYGYGADAHAQRIRFTTAYFGGAALDWWEFLADAERPATWDGLEKALRQRFQFEATAVTARAKLLALTQGKSSVNEYVSSFRRLLVAVPTMSEDDRLFQFTRGLQPAIATQLRVQGVATLDAAIAMASRIGSLKDMHASAAGAASSAASAAASSSSNTAAPMDLDALLGGSIEGLEQETAGTATATNAPVTRAEFQQLLNAMREQRSRSHRGAGGSGQEGQRQRGAGQPRPLPVLSHLTPAQVKEYMDAGKCFSCGSTEHMSRYCPKRPAKPKQGN